MKKIIFFLILSLLVLSNIGSATQSSEEYIGCLSKKLYKECDKGINTCGKDLEDGCPNELQPFTKKSIFGYLQNYENQSSDCDIACRQSVLMCKKENDFYGVIREGADLYEYRIWEGGKFISKSISCPINNYYFYITIISIWGISLLGGITFISIKLWKKYKGRKTNHNAPKRRK